MATYAVWQQAKVHQRGLIGCGLGSTLALSVTHSAAEAAYAGYDPI